MHLKSALLVLSALLSATLPVRAEQEPAIPRFVQERLAIGFWVDPPADQITEDRYREIADAHFNLVIGGFGARTPPQIAQQLALCERFGLNAIVRAASLQAADLPESPACLGYILRDEPGAGEFPGLGRLVEQLRQLRPGRLALINLYPNYAPPAALGTANYNEHVRQFVDQANPDILCMDHYPFIEPHAETRQAYCDNLAVLREHALRHGVPFWNFFNTMPFGTHSDPTEAQLRWQIFTSLAYGAKGVLYFCYWTPDGHEFPRGGAIITTDGRRTRHYGQAQRINAVLERLGPTLMQLTSTGVHRLTTDSDAAQVLASTPIRTMSPGEYLIGTFRHADGRSALLLNNYHHAYTAWPTVSFELDARVTEIDPATGQEVPIRNDSPDMPGLQLSLDAGEGRLLLIE